jgi:hypothetical protein
VTQLLGHDSTTRLASGHDSATSLASGHDSATRFDSGSCFVGEWLVVLGPSLYSKRLPCDYSELR